MSKRALIAASLLVVSFGLPERAISDEPPSLLVGRFREFGILRNAGGRVFRGAGSDGTPAKALVDINGDGRLDKVANADVSLGHGDGRFGVVTVEFEGGFVVGAGGDFNEDGYGDVLVLVPPGEGFHLFLGEPPGTLRYAGIAVHVRVNSFGATLPIVTDLDADGHLDVVGVLPLYLGFGDGDGGFVTPEGLDVPATQIVVGDLNADGRQDIVALVPVRGSSWLAPAVEIEILLTEKDHTLTRAQRFRVESLSATLERRPHFWGGNFGLAIGDLDADGHTDIVVGGDVGTLFAFAGQGDGTFGPERLLVELPVRALPLALLFEDLDLDGAVDLAVSYMWEPLKNHPGLQVYWGIGVAEFDLQRPSTLASSALGSPALMLPVTDPYRRFVRGDADLDGEVALADAVVILNELFRGAPMVCGDASDANDSGTLELTDAVYLLNFLFRGGPPPLTPYPESGIDLTIDHTPAWPFDELGCSFETYNISDFYPCAERDPAARESCGLPPLQVIDLTKL